MDDDEPDVGRPVEQPGAGDSNDAGDPRHGVRSWQVIVAIVVLVAVTAAIVVAVGRRTGTNEQGSTATSETTTMHGATEVPETGYSAPTQTAARDLDGFLTHAAMADRALTEAASRINASSTATEITYDQRTIDLLAGAAPDASARYLPPGMPDPLGRAALLTYSDLVSRWGAMGSGDCIKGVGTFPRADFDRCFTQGAPAAARFDGDLAALTTLAAATPAFAIPSQTSPAAEELAARIHYIDGQNLGCASTGGFVATEPIPVKWQTHPSTLEGQEAWQGYVADIDFRGVYDPADGWTIFLNAC